MLLSCFNSVQSYRADKKYDKHMSAVMVNNNSWSFTSQNHDLMRDGAVEGSWNF